jgi:hypothetical protein
MLKYKNVILVLMVNARELYIYRDLKVLEN